MLAGLTYGRNQSKNGQTCIPKTMRDHDWHDQRGVMQDLVGFKSCHHARHERISSCRGDLNPQHDLTADTQILLEQGIYPRFNAFSHDITDEDGNINPMPDLSSYFDYEFVI